MGRPKGGQPGRRERPAVLSAHYANAGGGGERKSTLLVDGMEESTGLRIAHHVVHGIPGEYGRAGAERGKSYQRSLTRFAKRYSNTMWQRTTRCSSRRQVARLVLGRRLAQGHGVGRL